MCVCVCQSDLTEFSAELSKFSLPKQYSRNRILPISQKDSIEPPKKAPPSLKGSIESSFGPRRSSERVFRTTGFYRTFCIETPLLRNSALVTVFRPFPTFPNTLKTLTSLNKEVRPFFPRRQWHLEFSLCFFP